MTGKRLVFDTESFINKSKSKYGDKFDYSQAVYTKAKERLKLRCIEHDCWFEIAPDTHSRGTSAGGCPECAHQIKGKYHKLSLEDFITRSAAVHNGFYDYSFVEPFKNAHTKVTISCPLHGHFSQTVSNHLHNAFGCSECAATSRGLASRLPQDDVIQRFIEFHGDRFDYSKVKYESFYVPVDIYCKEHDHWFQQKPSDHFRSIGCRHCIHKGYDIRKKGFLYINKVGDTEFIKIGITNVCPVERAKVINRKSIHDVSNLFYFEHEDGGFILDVENQIKNTFQCGLVPRDEMKSGYTETTHYENLPEIIDIIVYRFNEYTPA